MASRPSIPAADTAAYATLRVEFVRAIYVNPLRPIPTPGAARPFTRLVDVVAEYVAPGDDLHVLESVLALVTACSEAQDPATRLPAQALLARLADLYATEHASDFTAQGLEDRHVHS